MPAILLKYNPKREKLLLTGVFILFATIYCLISITNHYVFRTYSLDLGIFNNALYSFSHFKLNYFTADYSASHVNFFGDHFSPVVFLFVPFYYLFGSYTLLIIQILSVLFGGWGIYKYCKLRFPEGYIPLIILFQFFGIWGIYSALAFDFHSNVIAAMLVPWLLYHYEKQQKGPFLICFILILACKENMALWLIFILAGLILKKGLRNYKTWLRFEFPLIIATVVYFIIVVSHIMPYLQNEQNNYQLFRYSALGNSLGGMLGTAFKRPLYTLSLLFKNQSGNAELSNIKPEMYFMVLASGGLALLYRPYYLVMLLPIFAQKVLSDDTQLWGVDVQYSIEFAPILSLAIADSVAAIKPGRLKYSACITYAFVTFLATAKIIDHQASPFYNSTNTRFYSPRHYSSLLNLNAVYSALQLVPDNASVCASTALVPHLANRDKIYEFPNVLDAQYIVLFESKAKGTYPLNPNDYLKLMNQYRSSGSFETIYDNKELLILKKK